MEVLQKSSSCEHSDVDKAFGKKKPYSAAIDLTQDEEDDTEDEEALETMPSLKIIPSIS